MAIGLTTDDDFNRELLRVATRQSIQSNDSIKEGSVVDIISPGRKSGDINVPDALRQIIGEEAVIGGRQSALGLASAFGISSSSVSAYAKGATSTTSYNEPKASIKAHINRSRERAIKKASKTLDGALSAITQEKLDYTDAKDLSVIAKNMSAVIKDLSPEEVKDVPVSSGPQFVIYAPSFRTENSFEHISVTE